jgi:hypothetical protein
MGQACDREATVNAGFDHHMTKPIDMHQLSRLIGGLAGVAR